jgi:hypothetical protein
MYFARLHDCLVSDFPALRLLLGPAGFERLARAYVAARPPRSWTLNVLGWRLPAFLARPVPAEAATAEEVTVCGCGHGHGHGDADGHGHGHGEEPGRVHEPAGEGDSGGEDERPAVAWPPAPRERRLLRDVARLEVAMARVFDLPAPPPIAPEALRALSPARLARARLRPTPALRLLALGHRASPIVTAARAERPLPDLGPARSLLAVYRRGYQTVRLELAPAGYALLRALVRGRTVAAAIEEAAALWSGAPEALGRAIQGWFSEWAADGLFVRIEEPGRRPRP